MNWFNFFFLRAAFGVFFHHHMKAHMDCLDFRYEHPLLIEGRDKSEWVLPITVHAPPPGASTPHPRNEKPFSLEPMWVHN